VLGSDAKGAVMGGVLDAPLVAAAAPPSLS
jgi:hypothetical protein